MTCILLSSNSISHLLKPPFWTTVVLRYEEKDPNWAESFREQGPLLPSFCSLSKDVKPSCGTPDHRHLTPGYQPVSFKLDSRSGTPDEFEDMVSRPAVWNSNWGCWIRGFWITIIIIIILDYWIIDGILDGILDGTIVNGIYHHFGQLEYLLIGFFFWNWLLDLWMQFMLLY